MVQARLCWSGLPASAILIVAISSPHYGEADEPFSILRPGSTIYLEWCCWGGLY